MHELNALNVGLDDSKREWFMSDRSLGHTLPKTNLGLCRDFNQGRGTCHRGKDCHHAHITRTAQPVQPGAARPGAMCAVHQKRRSLSNLMPYLLMHVCLSHAMKMLVHAVPVRACMGMHTLYMSGTQHLLRTIVLPTLRQVYAVSMALGTQT